MQPTGDSEMTDIVEQWRKEFESIHGAQARFPNGEYCYPVDQYFWLGFCLAKRAQKPVELPKLTDPEADRWIQEMYLCVRKFDCSIPDQGLEQMRAILKLCVEKGE